MIVLDVALIVYHHLYFLVVYGRCLPGDIENQFEELQEKLNITAEDLEHVVIGQTHVNILADAKEV